MLNFYFLVKYLNNPLVIKFFYFISVSYTHLHERDKKRSNLVVLNEPILDDESNIDLVKVESNQLPETKRGEGVFKFYTVFLRSEQEAKLAAGEIDNTPENNAMFTFDWYLENVIKPDTEESIYLRIPTDEHLGAEGAVSSEETAERCV